MGYKLLLADDSVTIQKVVGIIFSGDEYDLKVVDNGDTALDRACEIMPDIMLVDALMPGKSGYDVCREVRKNPVLADIPILLLTGVFEPFDEEMAREAGADDFITKPFESQTLMDKVSELIARGIARKRTPAPAPSLPDDGGHPPTALEIPEETLAVAETVPAIAASQGEVEALPEFLSPSAAIFPSDEELLEPLEVAPEEDLWGIGAAVESPAGETLSGEAPEKKEDENLPILDELEPFVFEEEGEPPEDVPPHADVQDRSLEEFLQKDIVEAPGQAGFEEFDLEIPETPSSRSGLPGDEEFPFEIGVAPGPAAHTPDLDDFMYDEETSEIPPLTDAAWEEFIPTESFPSNSASEVAVTPSDVGEDFLTAAVGIPPSPAAEMPPSATPHPLAETSGIETALSEEQIAAAISKVSKEIIERIVWEVVPDLAEALIKEEIRKIREGV